MQPTGVIVTTATSAPQSAPNATENDKQPATATQRRAAGGVAGALLASGATSSRCSGFK